MPTDTKDFFNSLPRARRRTIKRRASELLAEYMTLQELRQSRKLTQVHLAKTLGVAQKQISEIEKRTDMRISTLRRTVEAMGGSLDIVVQFPDRAPVHITGIAIDL